MSGNRVSVGGGGGGAVKPFNFFVPPSTLMFRSGALR